MGTITWNTGVDAPGCPGEILSDDGRSILVQTDWDYPGTASSFGWSLSEVQPAKRTAYFDRFALTLPTDAISECSHAGDCSADVESWASEIDRPAECTPDALRAELREYGAWDDAQLSDDDANWERIVWIAAGNLKEEKPCDHDRTDGTVDCPECGLSASEFISAAGDWLDEHDGATADDPGYFDDGE
jgi:hypothetical protein